MKDTSTKKAKSRAPEAVVVDRDELGRPVVARLDDCTACAFCERHCPDFAIDIVRSTGKA